MAARYRSGRSWSGAPVRKNVVIPAQSIDATAAWLAARDNGPAWKAVLTAAQERESLAPAAGRPSVR